MVPYVNQIMAVNSQSTHAKLQTELMPLTIYCAQPSC